MVIQGTERLPLAPRRVWEALNDPIVLKEAIPGCETLEEHDDGWRITLLAAVGPVKARFNGKLAVQNVCPERSYTLVFEGAGGIAGFGKGSAEVSLADHEGGTLLAYAAKAQVGGRIAQVGSRLMDGVAGRMAAEFFARFRDRIVPEDGEAVPEAIAAESQAVVPEAVGPEAVAAVSEPGAAAPSEPAVPWSTGAPQP